MPGIYAEQAPQRKRRKKGKGSNNSNFTKKILLGLLEVPIKAVKLIWKMIFVFPKTSLSLSFILISSVIIWQTLNFIYTYQEKIIPSTVLIYIDNIEAYSSISKITQEKLLVAKAQNQTRTQLVKNISDDLSKLDIIDEYWIRSGLDGKLQITATEQTPIFALESSNGSKYIISKKMKIITKNPVNSDKNLLTLSMPEFNHKLNNTKKSFDIPLNIPWLFSQTSLIKSKINYLTPLGFELDKIIYKSTSGFGLSIVKVTKPTPTAITEQTNPILDTKKSASVINLGENDLESKFTKLEELIKDLNNKQLVAESIDLNFADKAIIKLANAKDISAAL